MPGYALANGVLKNKFGATSHDELAAFEVEAVARRLVEVELGLFSPGDFGSEHLKAIHRHLFQDVYEWAGHTRDKRFTFSNVRSELKERSGRRNPPQLRQHVGRIEAVGGNPPTVFAAMADFRCASIRPTG